jgi:5-(hydroxymethyl)furfural/furfural oxidase
MEQAVWDYVIVGGGSAGCVLASRLSEKKSLRILLIEAGRDLPPGQEGPAIRDTYSGRAAFDPRNHWAGLKVTTRPFQGNRREASQRFYEQAKLLGGGSSINGQVANRGTPDDYNEWESLGAAGWNWESVLPYFIKLESDLNYSGPLHGGSGPVPIHRIPYSKWPGLSLAAERALTELGYEAIGDQNGIYTDGHFPITLSNNGSHRVSSSMAYLGEEVRRRPNLKIMTDTQVISIVFEGRRAKELAVLANGATRSIAAENIVVSAGAVHSPALLMRSGVGPAASLARAGIDCLHDLPGVGENLQEHPSISLSAFIKPSMRLGKSTRRHIHLGMRYSSGHATGGMPSDMFMMFASKSSWHPVGRQIATMLSWVNKVYSRGRVELTDPDPRAEPTASFNFMEDRRDLERLADSVHRMAGIFASQALREATGHVGVSSYSGVAKALGQHSAVNYLLTAPTAAVLDVLPPLRSVFFKTMVSGGYSLADLLADREALETYVRDHAFPQWHPCGTCQMGAVDDRMAVVDPHTARVHGLENLFVADASIMPTAPRANLNIPVIMIAERVSDLILAR